MSYTKKIALYDKVTIDGTDVSNAFKTIGVNLVDATQDASGFSETGFDETLQGSRAASFVGDIFYTPESHALLYPLFKNRTVFEMEWQPDGLVDPTREVWHGNVRMFGYNPSDARGNVSDMSGVTFAAADSAGIVADAAT